MSKFADIQIDPGIVKRAARGDAKAHEIIYRAYSAPVYSVCLRFTRVPAQAEDLLQETFIEVIRSIASFRGEAPLGIWIRRVYQFSHPGCFIGWPQLTCPPAESR